MMYKGIFKIAVVLVLFPWVTRAQQGVSLDSIRQVLTTINQSYDSAVYLTFDLNMAYDSDTTGKGDFDHSEVKGTYTLNGNHVRYELDQMEYMQNDSFSVAVLKQDRIIMVGRPRPVAGGQLLQYREMIDSFLLSADSLYDYTITQPAESAVRSIVFTAKNPVQAITERFQIDFWVKTHKLKQMIYTMKETIGEYSVEAVGIDKARKARFITTFSNYRREFTGEHLFDEAEYIFFESPAVIQPAEKYTGFQVYNYILP